MTTPGSRRLPPRRVCAITTGVATTELGTPLLSSAFALARDASSQKLLAYVNADIVLLPDFVSAVRRVRFSSFLGLGRRWDVPFAGPIENGGDFERRVRALVAESGSLALPDAIDWFVFDRTGPLTELPPFVVGRPGWDNWMISRARSLGLPVVDATRAVTAVHQAHDYAHVPERSGYRWYGPEASANFALIEGLERFQTRHDTHVLTRLGCLPALSLAASSRGCARGSCAASGRTRPRRLVPGRPGGSS